MDKTFENILEIEGINAKGFENILEIEGINAKGFGTIAKLVMIDQRLTIESKAIYSYFCLCWYGIQCISKCQ